MGRVTPLKEGGIAYLGSDAWSVRLIDDDVVIISRTGNHGVSEQFRRMPTDLFNDNYATWEAAKDAYSGHYYITPEEAADLFLIREEQLQQREEIAAENGWRNQ